VARKVEEARRDPKINAAIKTALKRFAARQPQSARTLRINDGKAPANTDTFVVATSLLLTTLSYDGHDGRDDNGAIAIDSRAETVGALTVLAVEDTN
jgi:hypothetical protein